MVWDAEEVVGKRFSSGGARIILARKIDTKYAVSLGGDVVKMLWAVGKEGQVDVLPFDEPLFLVRSRDAMALPTLLDYRERCALHSCPEEHIEGVSRMIEIFNQFKQLHPERMKIPGITVGR